MKLTNLLVIVVFLFLGFFLGRYWMMADIHDQMNQQDDEKVNLSDTNSQPEFSEMIGKENYKCCLEKPCFYCYQKNIQENQEIKCDCLEDVLEGNSPCGECIGEILEGKGNRFLAKYFAQAIAEEVGENQLSALKQVVSEKYNISSQEQI